MKTFKLCDSSSGYCLKFNLYVGKTSEEVISKCRKTYDFVVRILDGYKKLGYIVFMDNFYAGPDLFYNLLIDEKTAVCGKELTAANASNLVNIKLCYITIK